MVLQVDSSTKYDFLTS